MIKKNIFLLIAILIYANFVGANEVGANKLENLLQRIAGTATKTADFIETREINFLNEPLETTGYLEFQAPNTLIKHINQPKVSKQYITGNQLIIYENGVEINHFYLSSHPELATLINAIRWLLSANLTALKNSFHTTLHNSEQQWTLHFQPKDNLIKQTILDMSVSGENNQIRQIKVQQQNGDITTTQLYERDQ